MDTSNFVIRITLIDPNGNEVILDELQRSPEGMLFALVPQLGASNKVDAKALIG